MCINIMVGVVLDVFVAWQLLDGSMPSFAPLVSSFAVEQNSVSFPMVILFIYGHRCEPILHSEQMVSLKSWFNERASTVLAEKT